MSQSQPRVQEREQVISIGHPVISAKPQVAMRHSIYANITANSSIINFDNGSTESYNSVVKFNILNTTFTQNDNLTYAVYEQFGYPTFQDFILRKKAGETVKKVIEVTQSGVNKNWGCRR